MSGARREWVLSTLALLVGLVALVLALDSVFDSLLGHDVLIKQYQMNRLTVFIDPDNADSDDAYNLQQSLIAVGSGGFFGKGLGHATQSAGGFLPEFHRLRLRLPVRDLWLLRFLFAPVPLRAADLFDDSRRL